jgi:flavin-dependent dehydrogenase
LLTKVASLGFGYQPPRFVHAFQAELRLGQDHIREYLGNIIHVFFQVLRHIRFVAFTPKKEHVTVSVVSFRDVTAPDLTQALAQPMVRSLLPPGHVLADRYCRCRPRIGITPARKPFTDRLVIVGDACCSRYFKNGIESAFVTAQLAARAAFNSGVSASVLHRDYWKKVKRTLVRDNLYGRLLFQVLDIASRYKLLTQTYCSVASSKREDDPAVQLARQILWDLFTGNIPYRTIFFRGLSPRLQARLMVTTMSLVAKRMRSMFSGGGRGHMRQEETQESSG